MSITIELLVKFLGFIIVLISHYFLLKNSINIIAERQTSDHKSIVDITACLDRYRDKFNELISKIAVQDVRIKSVEDSFEKLCDKLDCHLEKEK